MKDRQKTSIIANILHWMEGMDSSRAISLSFLAIITVGTILLSLPISTATGESPQITTSLFTATSAVCVTGLVVVDTFSYWSIFGKVVIMILIQIGGLGLITLMMIFLVFSGQKVTLRDRIVIQASLNQNNLSGIIRLLKMVVKATFILEGIAAIVLTIRFLFNPGTSFLKAVSHGIFHAISAFCNAGFDILGANSLQNYLGDSTVNLTIMLLIVSGGIGFSVLAELFRNIRNFNKDGRRFSIKLFFDKLSLHSKIAILMTGGLISIGAVFFFIAESGNPQTMKDFTLSEKIWSSFFQSVTLRTAGFYTIPNIDMTLPSKVFSILLMLIGGSPGGTAGGIKTVTFGIIILTVTSVIAGKENTSAFSRRISQSSVYKAFTIIFAFLFFVFAATIALSFSEYGAAYKYEFIDLLYEVVSASATVGISTGITGSITTAGRLIITVCMYLGRIGPLTLLLALNMRSAKHRGSIEYPDEKVMIG